MFIYTKLKKLQSESIAIRLLGHFLFTDYSSKATPQ